MKPASGTLRNSKSLSQGQNPHLGLSKDETGCVGRHGVPITGGMRTGRGCPFTGRCARGIQSLPSSRGSDATPYCSVTVLATSGGTARSSQQGGVQKEGRKSKQTTQEPFSPDPILRLHPHRNLTWEENSPDSRGHSCLQLQVPATDVLDSLGTQPGAQANESFRNYCRHITDIRLIPNPSQQLVAVLAKEGSQPKPVPKETQECHIKAGTRMRL